MFKSPEARYALRSTLVGVASFLSSLSASMVGSSLTGGELVLALSTGFAGALAYAGLGAIAKPVEPSIGNKLDT